MNINKCFEQVFSAQLGFHTAEENEFLWSLAGKQCCSKPNKNLKPNETKNMVFLPLSKPKTGNLHCHKRSAD